MYFTDVSGAPWEIRLKRLKLSDCVRTAKCLCYGLQGAQYVSNKHFGPGWYTEGNRRVVVLVLPPQRLSPFVPQQIGTDYILKLFFFFKD